MPQSLSQLYVHLVFSTQNREPWLRGDLCTRTHAYLASVSNDLSACALTVGGVADHVHLLARFPRTLTIADWVSKIKSHSSRWVKAQSETRDLAGFTWQKGYGAFSISATHVAAVRTYIQQQVEHHQKATFQDEYRGLLQKHGVEFDERYVWD